MQSLPKDPVLQVIAQSKDANPRGDMFGGWLMGLMDLAGVIPIAREYQNEMATAAVNSMQFLQPVFVNAHIAVTAEIKHVGNASITVDVAIYATYQEDDQYKQVATAEIVYVAIAKFGQPTRWSRKPVNLTLDL